MGDEGRECWILGVLVGVMVCKWVGFGAYR